MAKCPNQTCKKEITELTYNSTVEAIQDFNIDKNGDADYSSINELGNHSDEKYICPYCGQLIATEEEEAIAFLKGE